MDRDVDLAGGFGTSNSIHLDSVEFEDLFLLGIYRALRAVSLCAVGGSCLGRAEEGNAILSDFVFGRLLCTFLLCFRLVRAFLFWYGDIRAGFRLRRYSGFLGARCRNDQRAQYDD